ncbi:MULTISPECIES: DUF4097 family beta strand repeat-containing protein [unclassified Enterococcus]|uniref:DUF4097 family beta strand repeat-containing protein n=1 Tax=unclassified Enterococcus TaxID=2608891 RepID=UPI0015551A6B|nr:MULTISPECIES: DUF4097 family beta strand repeat-containing protein [unclassified Enterococcus]MBS7576000.1 DUF4097 family beta strand repeat protein [Enterococcus sp. MMGLQ5-2]MBS7583233.1 DUF4097 family beta strand repeat protein [Enterococcus sp. MMGLQ5-1]NPD11093.1 DUF4097 family beta strand repeat protein [Enterococcus sp. MMGLQ5-1]NPD35836.1 DUF4097 family beta strand repeat protein [Enterococcus sp. MMGLQ5-2]
MKTRKIISTACFLITVGIVLMIIGGMNGASMGLNVIKTEQNSIEVIPNKKIKTIEQKIDGSIKDIELENYDLQIKKGTENKISISYYQQKPEFELANQTLKVKENEQGLGSIGNFSFSSKSEVLQLVLTVADSTFFDDLTVNSKGSSYLEINDLTLSNLVINNKNGSIEINNVTSEQMALQSRNSSIEITDSVLPLLNIEQRNGDIEITDTTLAAGKITQRNGMIDFENNLIDGLDIQIKQGVIDIDDEEVVNNHYQKRSTNQALTINIEKGSFELN